MNGLLLALLPRDVAKVVPRGRIGLPTPAFSARRSTTELPRHYCLTASADPERSEGSRHVLNIFM